MTLSITTLSYYAECGVLSIVMLNVVLLSVVGPCLAQVGGTAGGA